MTRAQRVAPVADHTDLTPQWLTRALGAEVTDAVTERVGTGQMGECYSVALRGSPGLPATVLAKLPTRDQAKREFLHGSYATEVTFYRDLQATLAVQAPKAYYAEISDDPGQRGVFTLLLENLAPATQGDQIAGCSPSEALQAVTNVAGLHAPRWNDSSLLAVDGFSLGGQEDSDMMDALFPDAIKTVIGQLGDLIHAQDAFTLNDCTPFAGRWSTTSPNRFAPVHGDYRLDNVLFDPDGQVWAVDWQTLALGLPARDVAFFVASGLSIDDRRTHERALVEAYRVRLAELGVSDYSPQECWEDYRLAQLQTLLIAVFGCAYSGTRTERGDLMFATMIARGCQAIRDLDTLALLRAL